MIVQLTIASIAISVTVAAIWILPWIARRRRKCRLLTRNPQEFDAFFQDFYSGSPTNKELARIIHSAIALDLGVTPTQVYPDDRFDRELRCPWWGTGMSEFERFGDWLEELVAKNAGSSRHLKLDSVSTVAELIEHVQAILPEGFPSPDAHIPDFSKYW